MKKIASILLSAVLVSALTTAAFAAGETEFTYNYTPDPAYDITIPASISLSAGSNDVLLYVQNARHFNNGRLSVSIGETKPNANDLVMVGFNDKGTNVGNMSYNITSASGQAINYIGNNKGDHVGKELASFLNSGTKIYTITPTPHDWTTTGNYSGTLVYNIEFMPKA